MPLELVRQHDAEFGATSEGEPLAELVADTRGCWVNPEWVWLVEAYSLDRLSGVQALMNAPRVHDDSYTAVRRCALPAGAQGAQWVRIKTENALGWYDRCATLARGRWWRSRLQAEFRLAQCAQAAGLRVAVPLAFRALARGARQAWLVVLEPHGVSSLAEYFGDPCARHPAERLQLMSELGRELARWHAAGFSHGQLSADHILIPAGATGPFTFLELGQAQLTAAISLQGRVGDLAELLASLAPPRVLRAEREALVDAYCAASPLPAEEPELRRLLAERRAAQARVVTRSAPLPPRPAAQRLAPFDTGPGAAMWCDLSDRSALVRAGLGGFDQVMAQREGRLLRTLSNRENWRIELRGAHGPYGAYLKKHRIRDWKLRLWARLRLPALASEGRIEAENIASLERDGIPTMRLIAFGERQQPDGVQESFVLTEELAGFQQLDHFLESRFPPRDPRGGRPAADFANLIREVARVAGEFHRRGHNHRDFYLCHFFVHEPAPGTFEVRLIDLQRMQSGRWFNS
ncbi:MAG: hypothetical protein JNG90_12485, partial [Planctomycetaceae bacterium]|nr:hypothetical protein [Planctomycetaceae bacterium]